MIKELCKSVPDVPLSDIRIREFRFSKVEVGVEGRLGCFAALGFILPKVQYTEEIKAVIEPMLLKKANDFGAVRPMPFFGRSEFNLLTDNEKRAYSMLDANTVYLSKYDVNTNVLCYARLPKVFVKEIGTIGIPSLLIIAAVVRWYIELHERTSREDVNSAHMSSLCSYLTGEVNSFLAVTASKHGIKYKLNLTEKYIELECLDLADPCEFTLPTDIVYLKKSLASWINRFSLVDHDENAVEPKLHLSTEQAVQNTCDDVKAKLLKAQIKYGLTRGWEFPPEGTTDGEGDGRFFMTEEQLNVALRNHLEKGDILDCIAYLTFLHTKGWKLNV